jgi:hypothetical protein
MHICDGSNDKPTMDWQQLTQENGCLRVIIAELLIKNQNLRWALEKNPRAIAGS